MKISEIYGYNFPLNWDGETPIDKIKEALVRQIGYEISVLEPYSDDVERLAEDDWITISEAHSYISKWIEKRVDEHIQII